MVVVEGVVLVLVLVLDAVFLVVLVVVVVVVVVITRSAGGVWLSARIFSCLEKTNRGFNIRELALTLPLTPAWSSSLFVFSDICFLFLDLSKHIKETIKLNI